MTTMEAPVRAATEAQVRPFMATVTDEQRADAQYDNVRARMERDGSTFEDAAVAIACDALMQFWTFEKESK